ncbi:MAG TPA: DUF1501 domain-containing protein [Acidimicrobiales bacterium]|nr:DUF1501 domain-containing protein [Acidimicrobiales bacterium]
MSEGSMSEPRTFTRRQILGGALVAAAAGAAGYAAVSRPWQAVRSGSASAVRRGEGILVLVTLYGGNDGLNTVIPAADPAYQRGRGALAFSPAEVHDLGDGLGFHPSLAALARRWKEGTLAVVRGVGYPQPNRSHFRSMDIWQSGVPDRQEVTGWIGRWLDTETPDPLRALSLGPNLPRLLQGATTSGSAVPSMSANGATPFGGALARLDRPAPGEPALLARVRQTGTDLLAVEAALAKAGPDASSPDRSTGPLAQQLDVVAGAITAGLPTRVYAVSLGGFDTHAGEKATQARLLGEVDAALDRFLTSVSADARGRHAVVVVYTEFGRRVAANASGGTDHGTAGPVLVLGEGVRGGFVGDEPSLTDLDDGDLVMTTDFRSVYATLLDRVLDVDPVTALGRPWPVLPFV